MQIASPISAEQLSNCSRQHTSAAKSVIMRTWIFMADVLSPPPPNLPLPLSDPGVV